MFDLVNGNLVFDFDSTYDYLRDCVGVSEEALDLAFSLNGQNEKTDSDRIAGTCPHHDGIG